MICNLSFCITIVVIIIHLNIEKVLILIQHHYHDVHYQNNIMNMKLNVKICLKHRVLFQNHIQNKRIFNLQQ